LALISPMYIGLVTQNAPPLRPSRTRPTTIIAGIVKKMGCL
jgi:hypothetical protein